MGYIGFYLFMIGLAAAGGALDRGGSMIGAITMTVVGAVLMRLYGEEDEDSEEENGEEKETDGITVSDTSDPVDKPSGAGRGRHGEDTQRGGGSGFPDSDDSILSWDNHCDGTQTKKRNLRGAGGVDREDRFGMGIFRL